MVGGGGAVRSAVPKAEEHAEAVLAALQRAGLPEAEIYLKEGRSRRLSLGLAGAEHQVLVE